MQEFVDDPDRARALGLRGYLYSEDGQVPSIEEHAREMEGIYLSAIRKGQGNA
jgi:hypothetical protein